MGLQPNCSASGSDRDARPPILAAVQNQPEEAAMPEIKLPEVKLPEFKLPESLRDVSREDIQKAMSDVKFKVELPKRSDIEKSIQKSLPTKPGPSPVPFAILAMLGGLVVGWLLATSPVTGPRISAAMGNARRKIDEWRNGGQNLDDEFDMGTDSMGSSYGSTLGTGSSLGGGTAVGPTTGLGTSTTTPTGTGVGRYDTTSASPDDTLGTGAEGVSSERF
jgi:hypothetical protein